MNKVEEIEDAVAPYQAVFGIRLIEKIIYAIHRLTQVNYRVCGTMFSWP